MGLTGAALIVLGILCISKPVATIISLAWIIGIVALVSGISTLLNWFNVRKYFPQSGSILLSAVLMIICGIMFLKNDLALAIILPVMFSFLLIFEGINLSVRSFDYRKVGYKMWWLNLLLGVCITAFGFISVGAPAAGGAALSAFIGIGIITAGVFYFVALFAINRFNKKLNDPWVDEQ